jgi:hypothetical protein
MPLDFDRSNTAQPTSSLHVNASPHASHGDGVLQRGESHARTLDTETISVERGIVKTRSAGRTASRADSWR